MKQFAIYEGNMENLLKKIKRIENKCSKYGCTFHFAEVGEEFRELEDDQGRKYNARFILVEAEGIAVINGWKFIASVEHTAKGNILSKAVDVEVPDKYYTTSPICEHCKSNRSRKNTFIVMHEETGEFKQVGHSCLRDFTNGMSAEGVAQYTSWFDEIIKGEDHCGCGHHERYYQTEVILAYAAETIRKFGYTKGDFDAKSTKERCTDYYIVDHDGFPSYMSDYEYKCKVEMQEANFNPKSEEALSMVKDALSWIEHQDETNNYIHNLKTACSLQYVTTKQFGILVSLFPTFNKDLEKQLERKAKEDVLKKEQETSEFVGEIGQRITFKIASATCLTSWETEWGITKLFKIVDYSGNVFTWKTSAYPDFEKAETITGTIKAHSEFRDCKQTELTRCKVA